MKNNLLNAMTNLDKNETLQITENLLAEDTDPQEILDIGSRAMEVVGERFERGEYFLPELIVSGDILTAVTDLVKPHLVEEAASEVIGQVVLGTVEGDIHDIAKDIVVFMLEVNGFEVIDLGVDVSPESFVQAAEEHGIDIVGLSGFLTLAIEPMKRTIAALRKSSIPGIRVMIGGGPVDELVCKDTGADAWGKDAMEAVGIARKWAGVK